MCSRTLGCRPSPPPPPQPPYLSGARCFFSQLRSSSAGLVSALGLVLCRSESRPRNSQVSGGRLCPPDSWLCGGFPSSPIAMQPLTTGPWPLTMALWEGFSKPRPHRGVSQLPGHLPSPPQTPHVPCPSPGSAYIGPPACNSFLIQILLVQGAVQIPPVHKVAPRESPPGTPFHSSQVSGV